MMELHNILNNVSISQVFGKTDCPIRAINFDSRKVGKGDLFVATVGTVVDGHLFIDKAIELGATAVLCEVLPENLVSNVTYVQVIDSSEALGFAASNFYGNPSSKIKLIGVTGTNGKTTCATLLFELFQDLGYTVGLLSTVENKVNDEVIPSTHTTPDAVGLNALLAQMLEKGCTHCFMEVSSHAVHQKRIAGLDFDGAVFTNITHDHLDYHKTFANYIGAKKMFFDGLKKKAFALVNGDDKRGTVMLQNTKASKKYFALRTPADFKGRILDSTLQGLELDFNGHNLWVRLLGDFNAYNLLAVYGVAMELGEDEQEVLQIISLLKPVNGRFQQLVSPQGVVGVVDYAHTPDALENVLETLNHFKKGSTNIITVVGCGGDRDTEKRPVMAQIATKMSDRVIFTSDNPRTENPSSILKDMNEGVAITQKKKTITLEDRSEAIKLAVSFAQEGDIVLIAGKGHETYQEVDGVRHHFDDKEQLNKVFQLMQ